MRYAISENDDKMDKLFQDNLDIETQSKLLDKIISENNKNMMEEEEKKLIPDLDTSIDDIQVLLRQTSEK